MFLAPIKRLVLLALQIIVFQFVMAGTATDSLLQLIDNTKGEKEQAILYCTLAKSLQYTSADSAVNYAQKGFELSQTAEYDLGMAEASAIDTENATTMLTDGSGDAVFTGLADGSYPYTVTADCYEIGSGTAVVAVGNTTENIALIAQTSASVFVSISNHPIIGSWVDGNVQLTNGINIYTYDVTEFDNIIADVAFGTYDNVSCLHRCRLGNCR